MPKPEPKPDEVSVHLSFFIPQDDGTYYADALIFTEDEYDTIETKTIDSMKQERYDNYQAQLTTMQEAVPEPKLEADLLNQRAELLEQTAAIDRQLADAQEES